jgi:hypothetical protein
LDGWEAVGEDGAGGASNGDGAKFIGRGSQAASAAAFSGVLALTSRWQQVAAAATMAPGSRDDNSGGCRRKRTDKRDLTLSCGIADSDAGLEPASNASLRQGDEVASGHNIRSWC